MARELDTSYIEECLAVYEHMIEHSQWTPGRLVDVHAGDESPGINGLVSRAGAKTASQVGGCGQPITNSIGGRATLEKSPR